MHKPAEADFMMVKRIIRYLKDTSSFGLHLQQSSLSVHAFSDSDWARDLVDRRFVIGNCIFLGKNSILWTAKKQRSVAKSSTEAEYKSLAYTSMDLAWISMILRDLGVSLSQPPVLYCDNVSAIALIANPIFHSRTKHIEVDYHFVREKAQRKELTICFVPSEFQLANIFTKALSSPHFSTLKDKLMVIGDIRLRGVINDITKG